MEMHTLSNLEFVAEAFKGSTCDRRRLHARPGLAPRRQLLLP